MEPLPVLCPSCGGYLRAHSCDLRHGLCVLWCTRERVFLAVPLEGEALTACSTHARWNQASGTVPWPWEAEVVRQPKRRRREYQLPW